MVSRGVLPLPGLSVLPSILTIELGDGAGGFKAKATMQVGNGSVSIVVGDFNNDGNQDIATASSGENKVSIRMGDGTGDFSKTVYKVVSIPILGASKIPDYDIIDVPVGEFPQSLVLGDFNGDGVQDLAVACAGTPIPFVNRFEKGKITILLGDGRGFFSLVPGVNALTVGVNPSNIKVGDFNGDGKQDLAVINEDSNDLSIRFGKGDGTFIGEQQIAVGTTPTGLVVGDFNQDHIQDLAVVNSGSSDIMVFHGRTPEPQHFDIKGNGIAIANNDVEPSEEDGTEYLLSLLGGDASKRTFAIENNGEAIMFLNEGAISVGGADAALYTLNDIQYPIVLNPGVRFSFDVTFNPLELGTKTATVQVESASCAGSITHAFTVQASVMKTPELGNYGNQTIVLGEDLSVNPDVQPTLSNSFSNLVAYADPNFKGSLVSDPRTGIIKVLNPMPAGTYTVFVKGYENFAAGASIQKTFTLEVAPPKCSEGLFERKDNLTITKVATVQSAIGDFNGDGVLDIASVSADPDGNVTISLGVGDGTFLQGSAVAMGGDRLYDIAVSDFNGDGKQDFVTIDRDNSYAGKSNILVGLGNGDGTFNLQPKQPFPPIMIGNPAYEYTIGSKYFEIADVNNDGIQDVVVGTSYKRLFVFLAKGDGTFNEGQVKIVNFDIEDMVLGDLNKDGFADIISFYPFTYPNPKIEIQHGDGTGNFVQAQRFAMTSKNVRIEMGDFNNDGNQDYVATADSNLLVFLALGDGTYNTLIQKDIITKGLFNDINQHIAVGDFNGDSNMDLAITFSERIAVLAGNGKGVFAEGSEYPCLNYASTWSPVNLLVADFNRDGKQDIVRFNNSIFASSGAISLVGYNALDNEIVINDGDLSASLVQVSNFGETCVNTQLTKSYSIKNTSSTNLLLSPGDISIDGADQWLFSLNEGLPVTLAKDESVSFSVTFLPDSYGEKNATVHIAHADCSDTDYDFAIRGTVLNPDENPIVLGSYPNVTVITGENASFLPDAAPSNISGALATTDARFIGIFRVDPLTGELSVTNASPAGTYKVKVTGMGTCVSSEETFFDLTVTDPVCSNGTFAKADSIGFPDKEIIDYAIADFNNDGIQDLVVSTASTSLHIRLGKGGGTFSEVTSFIANNEKLILSTRFAVADFNGDGNQDIATVEGEHISMYLGDGTGSFDLTSRRKVPNLINFSALAETSDFNNDGKPDLLVLTSDDVTSNMSFFYGDGRGGFSDQIGIGVAEARLTSNATVEIKDFDGDGNNDIALRGYYNTFITLYFGDGLGGFGRTNKMLSDDIVATLNSADINNDGIEDLMIGVGATWEKNPDGTYKKDANDEFIIATWSKLLMYLGRGDGTFQMGTTLYLEGSESVADLHLDDLNGDGNMDVRATLRTNKGSQVVNYQGDGLGGFTHSFTMPVDVYVWMGSLTADLNGDGMLDILAFHRTTYVWYDNNTKLGYNNAIEVWLGQGPAISVSGNNTSILKGDNTPSEIDFTDFGAACKAENTVREFTIVNQAAQALILQNNAIQIEGVDADDFELAEINYPITIAAKASATFSLSFAPVTDGLKSATVSIMYNACAKNNYTFAIQGFRGDIIPPEIVCPVVKQYYYLAGNECAAKLDLLASATDNCTDVPVLTSDAPVGNQYAAGAHTLSFSATDDAGNQSTCSVSFVVIDNVPPVLICPANKVVEFGASLDPENTGMALVLDNCDAFATASFVDVGSPGLDGCDQFNYIINRYWTATDSAGNSVNCIQTISVVDHTAPEITCADDITIETNASTDPSNTGLVSVYDASDENPLVSYTDELFESGNEKQSIILRTWKVLDFCGNVSTCIQRITVGYNDTPVEEILASKSYLKLSPVPTKSILRMEWLGAGSSSITVQLTDVRGVQVQNFKTGSAIGLNACTLNVQGLAPGTYILIATVDGERMFRKFIKE